MAIELARHFSREKSAHRSKVNIATFITDYHHHPSALKNLTTLFNPREKVSFFAFSESRLFQECLNFPSVESALRIPSF
jgi:UDP-N-acetylmuramate-alanine ligase